jgi:hypothetical protein
MTRAARFSQADLTRAARAMEKAGLRVSGAKIETDGSILVLTDVGQAANDINPLERHLNG